MPNCKVKCPHCQEEYELDASALGQEFECPNCQQNFIAERALPEVKGPQMTIRRRPVQEPRQETFQPSGTEFQEPGYGYSRGEEEAKRALFAQYRVALAQFFARAEAAKTIGGVVAGLLSGVFAFLTWPITIARLILSAFLNPSDKILAIFRQVQQGDKQDLENLDVLPRYGKSRRQLVAPEQTLFSPAIGYGTDDDDESKSDGPSFKFAVTANEKVFIYSLEEFVKLYIFEDQLFVFKAYWDYTTGELFSESSEAFFFKDITNISTQSSYEYVQKKLSWQEFFQKNVATLLLLMVIFGILLFVGILLLVNQGVPGVLLLLFGSIIFIAIIAIMYGFSSKKVLVKRSETFAIAASSGCSIGVTILCDDWIEAKEGSVTERNDSEKIIQAIRKMIEEKKVAADA